MIDHRSEQHVGMRRLSEYNNPYILYISFPFLIVIPTSIIIFKCFYMLIIVVCSILIGLSNHNVKSTTVTLQLVSLSRFVSGISCLPYY